jgi:hypothetical protein
MSRQMSSAMVTALLALYKRHPEPVACNTRMTDVRTTQDGSSPKPLAKQQQEVGGFEGMPRLPATQTDDLHCTEQRLRHQKYINKIGAA